MYEQTKTVTSSGANLFDGATYGTGSRANENKGVAGFGMAAVGLSIVGSSIAFGNFMPNYLEPSGSKFTRPIARNIQSNSYGQRVFDAESIKDVADTLSKIKSMLGLNVSELAKIIRVQRPTIYEWLSGSVPKNNNLKRVKVMYELACEVSKYADANTIKRINLSSDKGIVYITDFLTNETIDKDLVINAVRAYSASMDAESAKPAISDRLAKKGFKPMDEKNQEWNINRYYGIG